MNQDPTILRRTRAYALMHCAHHAIPGVHAAGIEGGATATQSSLLIYILIAY